MLNCQGLKHFPNTCYSIIGEMIREEMIIKGSIAFQGYLLLHTRSAI